MSLKLFNLTKLTLATFIVSFTYFIGTVLFNGTTFYIFDCLWRLGILFALLFITKYQPPISPKQWGTLFVIFLVQIIAYKVFTPTLPFTRILISVAFAPVLEEIFFRGWMMSRIDGTRNQKILLSSFFFALYHLKNINVLTTTALLSQVIYAGLIVGPVFAYARLKYDSLFISLLLHSFNNTFADIVTPKIAPFITQRQEKFE